MIKCYYKNDLTFVDSFLSLIRKNLVALTHHNLSLEISIKFTTDIIKLLLGHFCRILTSYFYSIIFKIIFFNSMLLNNNNLFLLQ